MLPTRQQISSLKFTGRYARVFGPVMKGARIESTCQLWKVPMATLLWICRKQTRVAFGFAVSPKQLQRLILTRSLLDGVCERKLAAKFGPSAVRNAKRHGFDLLRG